MNSYMHRHGFDLWQHNNEIQVLGKKSLTRFNPRATEETKRKMRKSKRECKQITKANQLSKKLGFHYDCSFCKRKLQGRSSVLTHWERTHFNASEKSYR